MSTRDHDTEGRDLTQTSRDAAARLDAEIAAARPVPDFSAMLARARELAPAAVSEEDVARAAQLAPVIPLGAAERPAPTSDAAALAPFITALRSELDAKVAERRMSSIPPAPLPAPRRRLGLVVGLAVAVAAALLLVFVRPGELGRDGRGGGVAASAEGQKSTAGEARRAAPPERTVREAIVRPAPAEPVPADSPSEPVPADSQPAAAPVPADSRPAPAREAGRRPRPARPTEPAPAAPAPGPSLEDEAQALWERGELAAAERKYREILAVAGRGGRAELAYGDLFALIRQLRGADAQVDLWREYLGRFPAGRFADDARAGLCQRADEADRAACWRDYLERHPQGTHRRQAEAALATEDQERP